MDVAPSSNPKEEGKKFALMGLVFSFLAFVVFIAPNIVFVFVAPGLAFSIRALILTSRTKLKPYMIVSIISIAICALATLVRLS